MINRQLQPQIKKLLGGSKAIIIMGARQVGKSTLLKDLFGNSENTLWMNGDDLDIQELLKNMTSERFKTILGNNKYLVIGEAQRVPDIGLKRVFHNDC